MALAFDPNRAFFSDSFIQQQNIQTNRCILCDLTFVLLVTLL